MVGAQVVRQGSGGHVERLARSQLPATAPTCQGESPVARLWCVSRNMEKKVYSIENRHSKSIAWHVGYARFASFVLEYFDGRARKSFSHTPLIQVSRRALMRPTRREYGIV